MAGIARTGMRLQLADAKGVPVAQKQYRSITLNSQRLDHCWTTRCHEENPLRRFGPDTAGSCTGSARFRQDLDRDFAICASNRFREFRAGDAPAMHPPRLRRKKTAVGVSSAWRAGPPQRHNSRTARPNWTADAPIVAWCRISCSYNLAKIRSFQLAKVSQTDTEC